MGSPPRPDDRRRPRLRHRRRRRPLRRLQETTRLSSGRPPGPPVPSGSDASTGTRCPLLTTSSHRRPGGSSKRSLLQAEPGSSSPEFEPSAQSNRRPRPKRRRGPPAKLPWRTPSPRTLSPTTRGVSRSCSGRPCEPARMRAHGRRPTPDTVLCVGIACLEHHPGLVPSHRSPGSTQRPRDLGRKMVAECVDLGEWLTDWLGPSHLATALRGRNLVACKRGVRTHPHLVQVRCPPHSVSILAPVSARSGGLASEDRGRWRARRARDGSSTSRCRACR